MQPRYSVRVELGVKCPSWDTSVPSSAEGSLTPPDHTPKVPGHTKCRNPAQPLAAPRVGCRGRGWPPAPILGLHGDHSVVQGGPGGLPFPKAAWWRSTLTECELSVKKRLPSPTPQTP